MQHMPGAGYFEYNLFKFELNQKNNAKSISTQIVHCLWLIVPKGVREISDSNELLEYILYISNSIDGRRMLMNEKKR